MMHCIKCGVLEDVGEEVICEDCAGKSVKFRAMCILALVNLLLGFIFGVFGMKVFL